MTAGMAPILDARDITRDFAVRAARFSFRRQRSIRAVDGVSFTIDRGETLGLIGESGCGKSTVGRLVLGLTPLSGGHVRFEGRAVVDAQDGDWRRLRRRMQLVHQDPFAALDRRLPIGAQVMEPLEIHGIGANASERQAMARSLLARVGVDADLFGRYAFELSGGQRQRAVLARALILEPRLIVCDEAVSALDVSVQAQVVNLLLSLQEELDISFLFISHDLRIVRYVSKNVAVMYLGRFVEHGPAAEVFSHPRHPYTQALIGSMPKIGAGRNGTSVRLSGELPNLLDKPAGCPFHPRCRHATDICRRQVPPLRRIDGGPRVACHHAETVGGAQGS